MELNEDFKELNNELVSVCSLTNGMNELAFREDVTAELTPDAVYANTVLVLNDVDLPSLAGQEGFWDGVKKGATKVYEWIKQLIRTFRDWFNGKSKREYEEAKKNLSKDGVDIEDKVVELAKVFVMQSSSVNVPKESAIPKTAPIMRRLDSTDVKTIVTKFKEEMVAKEDSGAISDAANEAYAAIISKLSNGVNQIANQIDELKRIDGTAETQKLLGLSVDFNADWLMFDSMKNWKAGDNAVKDLEAVSKSLVLASENAQKASAQAAVTVERMNEKAKGDPDSEVQSKLARAVSVMKVVTEIAARYRDLVITMDSATLRAASKIVDVSIVRAIMDSVKDVSDRSAEYMEKAMNDIGIN
ncbi:hypothetical protein D5W64_12400 [Salmonella enterica subsp. enterica serovar Saintpaul]|nr:hypothetical protein [Salmonella enterica subsp. enterica serovar Saintpaul]